MALSVDGCPHHHEAALQFSTSREVSIHLPPSSFRVAPGSVLCLRLSTPLGHVVHKQTLEPSDEWCMLPAWHRGVRAMLCIEVGGCSLCIDATLHTEENPGSLDDAFEGCREIELRAVRILVHSAPDAQLQPATSSVQPAAKARPQDDDILDLDTVTGRGASALLAGTDNEADWSDAVGEWLRADAERPAAVRCWHGAVAMDEDAAFLVKEALTLAHHSRGGKTFWMTPTDTPRCSFERLALDILRFHTPLHTAHPDHPAHDASGESLGAEWWVQVRTDSQGEAASIGMHFDCDEVLKQAAGVNIPPWLATVTYLTAQGAPTMVLPIRADARGKPLITPEALTNDAQATGRAATTDDGGSDAFLSFPVAGKHLAFDGRLLHGCPHQIAKEYGSSYTRVTFLGAPSLPAQ